MTNRVLGVYTDALLQNHEMYIQQLQDTLRERAPILELINKHKDLLNDKEELAISSQDSSRLLGRGRHDPTRLLREERMRKRIAKELPKVELELKKMLEEWDEEYGCPFTVNGDDYLETLKVLSPVVQSRTNSVKSSSMNNLRGRSNTVSGSSTSARQRSKSRAAAKEPQRSKTPTPRPRTPANGQLFHSGSSTVGRNTGRQITSAASHYSSASSNGTGTLSRQGSAVRPKTPGFAPPRPSAPATSPTRNARPQLSSYATAPASGGGTIGRNNSSIKRKVANPTLGTAPRMQALRPATRQEDRLTDLLPSRSRHAPIPQFDPPSYPSRQHGSVHSIRSISPAESANYEVYPGSDEEDENTSHSFQDNTPRAAAYPSGRTSQLRVTGPRHDRSSIQSIQSVNSVNSVRSVQSAQSIISVVPRGGQDDTPLDPRKYSSGTDSTSSTLTRSNSGSENWETFGDDSDVESEDPREAYYQQKAAAGGQKGGYGNIGHGHPGTVRQSADRDAWMNDDQGY